MNSYLKKWLLTRKYAIVLAGIVLAVSVVSINLASDLSDLQALPYGSGTYGACQYDTCGITLTTSGAVVLGIIPTSSGVYTTASDTITVGTSSSTGYTLSLIDGDTDTNLNNGPNAIAPVSGTPASPVTLALNTWGYRVDGLGGFGPGPTSVQNNVSNLSYTFAGIPSSSQAAHTLKTTASAANPAVVTTVWYGVRVDTTKPGGVYSDQVTYTAVVNN